MTAATITDALARHWTRDPQKLRELVRDTWFLEVAEQLVDTTPDAAAVGRGLATLLVKPDGIATGSARTVVDWLGETGFVIRDAVAVTMDPNGIRALWYHQWNIASGERRMLADLLCGLSPALLLVVGREPAGVGRPCAVVLTERKGPTAPDRRRPEHLRGRLPGGSYLLNQVHTADEPADALRELGVYLTTRRRQVCLDRVAAGHDATGEAARIADDLDARYGGHTTDPGPAWAALADSRLPDESDAGLCGRLLRAADPVPGHLTWPLIVAGAECLPMRTPGGSVVLATPPATANEAPTAAAMSDRGSRDSMTIASRAPVHHGSNRPGATRCATIAHTSPIGIDTDPSETPSPTENASSATSGIRMSTSGRRRGGADGVAGRRSRPEASATGSTTVVTWSPRTPAGTARGRWCPRPSRCGSSRTDRPAGSPRNGPRARPAWWP